MSTQPTSAVQAGDLVQATIHGSVLMIPRNIACPHITANGECSDRCFVFDFVPGNVVCCNPYCQGHTERSQPRCFGPGGVIPYAWWRGWRASLYDVMNEQRLELDDLDQTIYLLNLQDRGQGGPTGYRLADDYEDAYANVQVWNGRRFGYGDPNYRTRADELWIRTSLDADDDNTTLTHGARPYMLPGDIRQRRPRDPPGPAPYAGGRAAGAGSPRGSVTARSGPPASSGSPARSGPRGPSQAYYESGSEYE